MSTLLYNVLSGLHKSDTLLSSTITTLSSKISPAFTANSFTVGSGTGLSASQYVLPASDSKLSGDFGTPTTVATEANAKTYVDAKIAAANAAAITGATWNDAISGTVTPYDGGKHLTVGVKVDDKTIKVSGGVLSAALTLRSKSQTTEGYASTYELVDATGASHGEIDIPKDQFLKDAAFGYSTANDNSGTDWNTAKTDDRKYPVLKLTFDIDKTEGDGETASEATNSDREVFINLYSLVDIYTGGTGIEVSGYTITWKPVAGNGIGINGATISAQLNATDDNDGFLKLNANGLYTSGIKQFVNDTTSAMVTAPSNFAEADQIILANDNKKAVKSSGKTIATSVTDTNDTIPTSKAVSSFVTEKTITAGMVTAGATLTANQFVLGSGDKTVKTTGLTLASGYNGITDVDTTIPTSKAVSGLVSGAIATANAKNVTAEIEWSTSGKLVVTDDAPGRKIKQSDYTVETTGAVTSSNNAATSIPTNATIWASISGLVKGPDTNADTGIPVFDGANSRTIKDSGKKFSTAVVSSESTDAQIPTALAVYASISGFVAPSGSTFADNHIALFADTTGRKIKDSAQTITTDAPTSSSTSGTIPTSNAVWSAISGFVTGSGLTADKIVLGDGSQNVKTSGIGIAESMTDDSDDTIVPTAGAVAAYVTDQLAGLKSQIEALNTAISNLNS